MAAVCLSSRKYCVLDKLGECIGVGHPLFLLLFFDLYVILNNFIKVIMVQENNVNNVVQPGNALTSTRNLI